jgi:exosome complex component RRP4
VTPGDLLAEGDYVAGNNTYKHDSKIYASRLGLVEYKGKNVQVVALNNFYVPSVGDLVIGKIVEVNLHGWTVDINSPYSAILKASEAFNKQFRPQKDELSEFLDINDLILAKVIAFDRARDPSLTIREPELGKISYGQIVKVSPAKIPRIIGRKGSMITMLKKETNCSITVGQNGLILISGKNREDERIAISAIKKIEQEAHTSGLTDRVTEMIRKERGER